MTKIFTPRTALLGFLTWFIPLAVSFAFIDRNGQFLIPQPLFKSLMVVVGGGVGVWLLVLAFRRIAPSFPIWPVARVGVLAGAESRAGSCRVGANGKNDRARLVSGYWPALSAAADGQRWHGRGWGETGRVTPCPH